MARTGEKEGGREALGEREPVVNRGNKEASSYILGSIHREGGSWLAQAVENAQLLILGLEVQAPCWV